MSAGCGREERREYWRRQVTAWQRSGCSRAEFCRRHQLSRYQLAYWLQRFDGEQPDEFVSVSAAVPTASDPEEHASKSEMLFELRLQSGALQVSWNTGLFRLWAGQ